MVDIWQASVDDAELLGALLWRFNTEFDSATDAAVVLAGRFARILTHSDVLALLATADGTTTGFCLVTLRPAIWFDGPVAQLEELYVVPSRRGLGTGSAILNEARRRVLDRGAPEMHINVDEPDTDARRFYERHGFVTVEPGSEGRMLRYVGETRPR